MTYGFTGTRRGMTPGQLHAVQQLFRDLNLTVLHHGDCIGADEEADAIAQDCAERIVVHPPLDSANRAWCGHQYSYIVYRHEIRSPRPFLERNRHIVTEGVDGLIATPKEFMAPKSKRGHGTWTTIGYAYELKRPVWIVVPDGTWRQE